MTYLRHATRHIQKTIIDRVRAGLVTDGWLDHAPGQGPFGTDDITFYARRIAESEMTSGNSGNLVAVFFGNEPDDIPQELGGGVTLIEHILYCDVVGSDDSLSLAIASDIKDRLSGLAPGTSRFEPVYDYTADPRTPVSGYQIEFVDVQRIRPEGDDYRRLWNSVGAMAEVLLTGNE
jgi:hypothetical protein